MELKTVLQMHTDDAYDHLVKALTKVLEVRAGHPVPHNQRPYGCDIWIPNVAWEYWRTRVAANVTDVAALPDEHFRPFYDAAWELCRVGVMRPGNVIARGQAMGTGFAGDGYSLTSFGRQWLKDAAQRPLLGDSGRLAEVLTSLGPKFSDGYRQRASEAVHCYRTASYLATCVMAGAAAESILLAAAIAKAGDEKKVLSEYASQGGRGRVLKRLLINVPPGIASQFQHASQILHYWRDDAAHGTFTTISEVEAHTSLNQLLRLAQFTDDHWAKLTA